ncbi:type VII toxin-antitoxin system HepT family RNase toxin [Helicovermis profundi]|uniref:Type II toxin-antitoxin system toxin n=1 Tax=Helicovermis profundi TaxID=3065157 RepID=A0AAU9E0L1_9FIRM|nr:type II toxin-antitoxin system toxin [Clostridia bacterium S502]
MANDVIYNKVSIIEKCIDRINEEYLGNPDNLENFTKQDSIILNIQRASEAAIDLAMHIISENSLGIPQNSRDGFEILYKNEFIDLKLCTKLKAMVGFRNIAVHDYQEINIEIIEKIIDKHIYDIKEFSKVCLKLIK